MKSTTKLLLAAFGWAALVSANVGFSAPPDKPRFLIAKLGRGQLNELWLDASVENVQGAMIVDTGAGLTMLGQDKFGFLLRGPEHTLPPGAAATVHVNSLTAKVTMARDFRVGGNDLGGAPVAIVGNRYLSSDAFPYRGRKGGFDGVMGENFLRRYRAVIDCHRQLLYLNLGAVWKDNLAAVLPAGGWTRIPMAATDGGFTVPCALNGHRFRLVVDTGSSFTTVDKNLIDAAHLPFRDVPIRMGLIGNDPTPLEAAPVKELQIGDYTAADVHLTTIEHLLREQTLARDGDALPIIGLLGGDTLGFNGAIIDVGEHALYLKHR